MADHIRTANRDDLEPIKAIAVTTGLFTVEDVAIFDEMLLAAIDGLKPDDAWLILEDEQGQVAGAAYYAPEPFSDRLWNLYFLGVRPDQQGKGGGKVLVDAVETELRTKGSDQARVLLIETSGMPSFEATRQFYRNLGFDEEARIRQFYGPDDDKIVFWKSLVTA